MNLDQIAFTEALVSEGPAEDHREARMTYGQFVGRWRTETTEWLPDRSTRFSAWDVRFCWVLEGRAIQDLWITPPPGEVLPVAYDAPVRYGTTLRIYDPASDAWHIIWADAPSGRVLRQTGRRIGSEIVQVGEREPDGSQSRWVFRDITWGSFRWCNERSDDGGVSWRLAQQMLATRLD